MKASTSKALADAWCRIEDADPDISTEALFAKTVDEGQRLFGPHIDEGHVTRALQENLPTRPKDAKR